MPRSLNRLAVAASSAAAVMASAAGACTSDTVRASPPPEIAYVAAVVEDEGALVFSTGLRRVGADADRVTAENGRVRILGWPEASIRAFDPPPDAELAAAKLRPGASCEQRLPTPAWIHDPSSAEAAPPAVFETLTTDWINQRCPRAITGERRADVDCAEAGSPSTIRTDGCEIGFEIALPSGVGTVHGRVHHDGRLCVDQTGGPIASCSGRVETSSTVLDCAINEGASSCEMVFHPPSSPELVAGVRRLQLTTPTAGWEPQPAENYRAGYISDLIITGGRGVALVHRSPGFVPDCLWPYPSRLAFIDLERVEVTGTATAPACLAFLLPDPTSADGGSFLGLYRVHGPQNPPFVLARFDATGKKIRSVEVQNLPGPDVNVAYRPVGFAAVENPARLGIFVVSFVTVASDPSNRRRPEQLLTFDPETLEERERSEVLPRLDAQALISAGPDLFAVSTESDNCVHLFGATGERSSRIQCGAALGKLGPLLYHAPSERILVQDRDLTPAVRVFSLDGFLRAAAVFERDALPTGLAPWPNDPRHVAVALLDAVAQSERHTWLARVDPLTGRFVPGISRIGDTPIAHLRTDGRRLWAVMPWTAEIARIEVR